MEMEGRSGIWSLFVPNLKQGERYKYEVQTKKGKKLLKSDPFAFYSEHKPATASRVYDLEGYEWNDKAWQSAKKKNSSYNRPSNIYEVHLGTWKRKEDNSYSTYRDMAHELVDYVAEMGYTHIELLPLAEHPFDLSWGYQITGYYSVTSRFGEPKDFMYFVDCCHQKGIGVIMDWVPGHFCKDDHGLRQFDGEPVYEYEDPRKAEKHQWGTLAFDYGKPEVQSFLISNALFWMDKFHIDGIRVDAVASMLDLNFGRDHDKIFNLFGEEVNLEAVDFLKKLNKTVFHYFPNALMMAEDSSDWPLVTGPVHDGGLGFNYKWNMGWMNDMLEYMEMDPIYRSHHHKLLTFSFMYTFSENYVLPFSHDEVVHGKKSMLNKMPGDYWQKFASLRALYGYQMGHPGKKLLFMGGEFGQFIEWKDEESLDWCLLQYDMHQNMQRYVKELNRLYSQEAALWELDHHPDGFHFVNPHDSSQSCVAFFRQGSKSKDWILIVSNFTPVVHPDYRIGVPEPGVYTEVFNSDKAEYGGSNQYNGLPLKAEEYEWHGMPYSVRMIVPPLATVFIKLKKKARKITKKERM